MPVFYKFYIKIAIYCYSECNYKIKVSLKNEYPIDDGDRISDFIKNTETRLFSFNVPSDNDIKSIAVNLFVGSTNVTSIKMFVSPAKDPKTVPSSSNTITVLPSWKGLTAINYDSSTDFCRGCQYKIMISSKTDTSFVLSYRTNKGVVKITEPGIDIYDTVGIAERNCYVYNIPSQLASNTMSVYLKLYSGFANLNLNPSKLPDVGGQFAFATVQDMDGVITLSKDQREKLQANTGNYYICVIGEYFASYDLLLVMEDPKDQKRLPIYAGLARTMSVDADKLILFEYELENKEKTELEFILTSLTGDADLYVKYCIYTVNQYGENTNSCDLNKNELDSDDILSSTTSESVDYIWTNFDPSMCKGKNVKCTYLIGILGLVDTKFTLTVTSKISSEIALVEGVPFFGAVNLRQAFSFTFAVRDPATTSIKVQLTSLTGDADLTVTRESDNNMKISSRSTMAVDSVEFTRESDGPLNTAYHVAVRGYTVATFTLVYYTTAPRHAVSVLELYDGQPQKAVFKTTEYKAVYAFGVAFNKDAAKDIRIFMLPITGEYDVYVGVNFVPSSSNYTYKFNRYDTSLFISHNDQKYQRIGTYYVLIEKLFQFNTNPHSFTVKYITGQYATTLLDGVPEIANLTKSDIAYYKYFLTNTTNDVTISVTPLYGDPDLYISLNNSNQLPSPNNYNLVSAAVGGDFITIPISKLQELNKKCSGELTIGGDCGIYIAVICPRDDCSYSLQLGNSPSSALRLVEGIPQFGFTQGGQPEFFLFSPNNTDFPTVISIQPLRGSLKAYAKLVPFGNSAEKPTPEKYDIKSSQVANSEVITVSKEQRKSCNGQCDLYIGVYVDMGNSMPGKTEVAEYTIMATSSLMLLTQGTNIIDYVSTGGYKYYKFIVPCTNCNMTISIIPLSEGDPDLYVNKGNVLPTKENSHFKSASYKSDTLILTPNDDYFKKANTNIQGEYTIAVYGFRNCTYSISASSTSSSNANLQELTLGMPTRYEQDEGEIKYFGFTSWKSANIKITIQLAYGRINIRANAFQDNGKIILESILPSSEANSKWTTLKSNTINFLEIPADSPGFLPEGVYAIGVEARQDSAYSIIVEYGNSEDLSYLEMGKSRRVTLSNGQKVRFALIVDSYENLTISTYSLYGDINGGVSLSQNGNFIWTFGGNTDLTIAGNDPKFVLGKYYITIAANSDTDFILQAKQNAKYSWVSEGLPYTGVANNKRITYFLYKIPRIENDNEYVLNVFVSFKSVIEDAKLFVKLASDETLPTEQNSDYQLLYDPYMNTVSGSMIINATKTNVVALGVYADLGDHGNSVKFTITTWSQGVLLLPIGETYLNTFRNRNESHTYEVNMKESGKLYVEVSPCSGDMIFLVTQNLTDTNNPSYDLVKAVIEKGRLFGSFQADKGKYYITVKPINLNEKTRVAEYVVRALVSTAKSPADLDNYALQKDGKLKSELSGHEVKLEWGSVIKKSEEDSIVPGVVYTVFMAESKSTNMVTTCGMLSGRADPVVMRTSETKAKIKVPDKYKGKKITINVVAFIQDHYQTFAYTPVELDMPKAHTEDSLLKVFLFLVVVAIGVGIAYYMNKVRPYESGNSNVNDSQRVRIEPVNEQSELRELAPSTHYTAQND